MSTFYTVNIVLIALGILIVISRAFVRKKSGAIEIKRYPNELKVIKSSDDARAIPIGKAKKIPQDIPDRPEPILAFADVPANHAKKGVDAINTAPDEKTSRLLRQFGTYDHKLELATYKYPPIDLLENYCTSSIPVDPNELEAHKIKIIETFNYANIEIDKIKATVGPTLTLYEITPAPGVRVAKVKSLEKDIALVLAVSGTRIIDPIPGKGTMGIEVPRQNPEIVSMRSILATERFQTTAMVLPVAFGKKMINEVFMADLAEMPHLLISGATGQGKSVFINGLLISLLYKKHPSELKLVLIDLGGLELTIFKKIERHFLAKLPDEPGSVITDVKKAVNTLDAICIEIDQRYDLLKDAQARHLKEYNQKFIDRKIHNPEMHRFLPYIVVVIDEFADLIRYDRSVESLIARIAQQGCPVGVHFVISTQRPSVNIITGIIKANFPSRLAFRVSSAIDSRTILDDLGASQLKGDGDMLFSNGSELVHLQCAFVDTTDVVKICNYIGNQKGYPAAMLLPEYVGGEEFNIKKDFDADNLDPMFEESARLVVMHQQGSTSLIQRKLKLGYNRAGRIIDQLEAAEIVGAFKGDKAREVLYQDELSLERYLEKIRK